ncbi:MAG: hypothetical protein H6712_35135, partial [Myxococcales bacterium]|nr:hypothetical protein [Myxococcales bacterium]
MSTLETVLLGLAALAVSVTSVAYTFRQNQKISRANTFTNIKSRLFALNKLELENRGIFEQLYGPFELTAIEKGGENGLGHYLYMLFNLYEEVWFQYQNYDLSKDDQFDAWKARIETDLAQREFMRGYWKYTRDAFPDI